LSESFYIKNMRIYKNLYDDTRLVGYQKLRWKCEIIEINLLIKEFMTTDLLLCMCFVFN